MPPQASLWKGQPDLVGLQITLQPTQSCTLPSNYTYWLHAWFLDQIRQIDPSLSAELHNNQAEKAFTLSGFLGTSSTIVLPGSTSGNRSIQFSADNLYHCQLTALNKNLCAALKKWQPPSTIRLQNIAFQVCEWQTSLPATTYAALWKQPIEELSLSFLSPTAFRKNGNHMPLPIPENLFHSYLRRWNIFARRQFEPKEFLEWVNESIVLLRHDIRSIKAQPGKQGSVTGFVGNIQLGFTSKAQHQPDYIQLTNALVAAAPYFSTGHKVTFGLGQTRSGWSNLVIPVPRIDRSSAENIVRSPNIVSSKKPLNSKPVAAGTVTTRIDELRPIFLAAKKRQGGERATKAAELWATIIAYQENGDSLQSIASDLNLPYDSVKKYSQLARRHLESIIHAMCD